MPHALAAAATALFVWWFATGLVVYAARRAEGRESAVLWFCGGVAVASLYGAYVAASHDGVFGAYLGFVSAIGVWAWPEMAFLLGRITGPNRAQCPADAAGVQRFVAAFRTIRDHELAIVAGGALIATASWGGENLTAVYAYGVLWSMRISAKLNIFLGAPNAVSALLPVRLAYLTSYFRTDRLSLFFPLSLALATAGFAACCIVAGAAETPAATAAWSLLAAFMGLALLEHVFLAVPIADSALWSWALPAEKPAPGKTDL